MSMTCGMPQIFPSYVLGVSTAGLKSSLTPSSSSVRSTTWPPWIWSSVGLPSKTSGPESVSSAAAVCRS